MKFPGHPSHHGHHVNVQTCGDRQHRACSGFSGGYDTYRCGCCCHDYDTELTDDERVIVQRLRGEAS
jgi:hypothetical protein